MTDNTQDWLSIARAFKPETKCDNKGGNIEPPHDPPSPPASTKETKETKITK